MLGQVQLSQKKTCDRCGLL